MLSITVSNYRCFAAPERATFEIVNGITTFVGPNNSGKTTLLRLVYELRPIWRQLAALPMPKGSPAHHQSVTFNLQDKGRVRTDFVFSDDNDGDLVVEVELSDRTFEERAYPDVPSETIRKIVLHVQRDSHIADVRIPQLPDERRNAFNLRHPEWVIYVGTQPPTTPRRAFDMLPIRTALEALYSSFYVGSGRNVVRIGGGSYYDLSVGTELIKRWRDWKTGDDRKNNRAIRRVEGQLRELFGLESLEINAAADLHAFQLVINGHPHKDDEIGSGMLQFLVVLANLAFEQPQLVLVDEPELNLHPRLQVQFVMAIQDFAQTALLLTTHSIGLARTVSSRIYSCSRIGRGRPRVRQLDATPNYSEFLGELSFSAYRELGYGSVLLVEGVTDVLVFKAFLRMLGYDQEVVILNLGGDAIASGTRDHELGEIVRLAPKIGAIVDSEAQEQGAPSSKRKRFQERCQSVGISCHLTERRAIENYFSSETLGRVSQAKDLTALSDYAAPKTWPKNNNWRFAEAMTKDELLATDIGIFLQSWCNENN